MRNGSSPRITTTSAFPKTMNQYAERSWLDRNDPGVDLTEETIFTWGAPPLKFGAGAVDEIGFEMERHLQNW
jgi:hypothetical protein